MKLVSWNVNGIRAIFKKDFINILKDINADVFAIQETKAQVNQLEKEIKEIEDLGYHCYFRDAERKGYSGVAIFTKEKPISVKYGLKDERFNHEGRTILAEFSDFYLFNIYFPNGQMNEERLKFKMDFYDAFLELSQELRKTGKNVIMCGDVNTAHTEIDIARPKQNENTSGFLKIERDWITKYIDNGYVDTFRLFNQDKDNYTWWSYRFGARKRNVGWRIDYFFVNQEMKDQVKDGFILSDVMGSDHCPLGIVI